MTEEAIQYYHPPQPISLRTVPPSTLERVEQYLARGHGDLMSRDLLSEAAAALRDYERREMLLWNRIEKALI
jgi:hypothetical protein